MVRQLKALKRQIYSSQWGEIKDCLRERDLFFLISGSLK